MTSLRLQHSAEALADSVCCRRSYLLAPCVVIICSKKQTLLLMFSDHSVHESVLPNCTVLNTHSSAYLVPSLITNISSTIIGSRQSILLFLISFLMNRLILLSNSLGQKYLFSNVCRPLSSFSFPFSVFLFVPLL